jgi:hypothetical protein
VNRRNDRRAASFFHTELPDAQAIGFTGFRFCPKTHPLCDGSSRLPYKIFSTKRVRRRGVKIVGAPLAPPGPPSTARPIAAHCFVQYNPRRDAAWGCNVTLIEAESSSWLIYSA